MVRPSLVIGSISALLSLAVILGSIFFLTYTFRTKCDIRAFDIQRLMHTTNHTSINGDHDGRFTFARTVNFTEIQGKCLFGEGEDIDQTQSEPEAEQGTEYNNTLISESISHSSESSLEKKGRAESVQIGEDIKGHPSPSPPVSSEYNPDECSIQCSIPKFKDCGGVGIGSGVLQFILAFFYIFWKKKTVPVMSAFFWSHLSVFLFHLTAFTVIMHTRAGSHPYTKEFYNGAFQTAFCTLIGVNCCFLLGVLVFLCTTCDTNDYYDHCGDKVHVSEKTQITAVSMRSANTF